MATYWENSCSFGLRYVSWYKYLIVSLVFSYLGFWSGNLFLIAPFPDLCLLVPFNNARSLHKHSKDVEFEPNVLAADVMGFAETRLCRRDENVHFGLKRLRLISLMTQEKISEQAKSWTCIICEGIFSNSKGCKVAMQVI